MSKTGRKGYGEEMQIIKRYSDLSVLYFGFLKECLEGDDKTDKKWAGDQLKGAFTKMIPQDVTSGGEALPQPILNYVQSNNSNEEGTTTESED